MSKLVIGKQRDRSYPSSRSIFRGRNGALTKLGSMQQKLGKASHSLGFLVPAQKLTAKKWIILLNIYPDQNFFRMWRSGRKLSSLIPERGSPYQRSLGPSFLHASSNNKEQEFEPPSERSLYRTIEVCSASMQKSLQRLDNISAEGTEAFDQASSMLESLADPDINVPATQKLLKHGKRYLKIDFKTHVGRDEQCGDHCIVHALSDINSGEFREEYDHQHSYECERCESLEGVLKELAGMLDKVNIKEEERAMLKFEGITGQYRVLAC